MGIWQIIYIALMCIGLGVHAAKHGEPRGGTYNFAGAVFSAGITTGVLYMGGFFG